MRAAYCLDLLSYLLIRKIKQGRDSNTYDADEKRDVSVSNFFFNISGNMRFLFSLKKKKTKKEKESWGWSKQNAEEQALLVGDRLARRGAVARLGRNETWKLMLL